MKFEWDEGNLTHISAHGIEPHEAEEIILGDPVDVVEQEHEDEVRLVQIGVTKRMRVLVVVTTWRDDLLRVVTAYDAPPSMRDFFFAERGQT